MVLAIFSVLSVAVTDIFMMILRSQRQTSSRERTLSDLRFITETIARQIRTSEIDYQTGRPAEERYRLDDDTGIVGWEKEIHLIDADNHKISYYLDGTTLKTETDNQLTVLSNPDFYTVTRLFFYIDPPTSPFVQERCNGGLNPNGCLPGTSCSLNDASGPNGYCVCQEPPNSPDDKKCATNNCSSVDGNYYCLPYNRQPRVTIILGFESKGNKPAERKTIYLETTAASRVYKR